MSIIRGNKTLTAREQKAQVMKWTGWTAKQYEREYDKLRNRTRNYEKAAGYKKGSINVADLLARDARARYYRPRYGETYKPTTLYAAISRTTSQSSGKQLTGKAFQRAQRGAFGSIGKGYSSLIKNSPFVRNAIQEYARKNKGKAITPQELENVIKSARDLARTSDKSEDLRWRSELRKGNITPKRISQFYEE